MTVQSWLRFWFLMSMACLLSGVATAATPSIATNTPPSTEATSTATAVATSVEFVVTEMSKTNDFRVEMPGGCQSRYPDSGLCEGAATLTIYAKNGKRTPQTLAFENISLILQEHRDNLDNGELPFLHQSSLVVDDFNFDGREDFAVQVGQDGPYGGPTFRVYLYQSKTERFELSRSLSKLTEQSLGFFQLDRQKKQILTFTKSGCCYHESRAYEWFRDRPIVVTRYVEDATSTDGFTIETTERLVRGRWVRNVRRTRNAEFGEDY